MDASILIDYYHFCSNEFVKNKSYTNTVVNINFNLYINIYSIFNSPKKKDWIIQSNQFIRYYEEVLPALLSQGAVGSNSTLE